MSARPSGAGEPPRRGRFASRRPGPARCWLGVARPCPGRGFLRDPTPLVDLRLPLRLPRRPCACGWCAPAGGRHQVPDRQSTGQQLHLHDPRSFRLPLPGRHGCDCSRLRARDPTQPRSGCGHGRAECAARPCRRCRAREHPLDHDGQAGSGPADGALVDAVLRDSGRPPSNSGPDGRRWPARTTSRAIHRARSSSGETRTTVATVRRTQRRSTGCSRSRPTRSPFESTVATPTTESSRRPRPCPIAAEYGVNKSRFFVAPGYQTLCLALNTARPLFANNPQLRRAVNYAIDRHALVAAFGAFVGTADRSVPPLRLTRLRGRAHLPDRRAEPREGAGACSRAHAERDRGDVHAQPRRRLPRRARRSSSTTSGRSGSTCRSSRFRRRRTLPAWASRSTSPTEAAATLLPTTTPTRS